VRSDGRCICAVPPYRRPLLHAAARAIGHIELLMHLLISMYEKYGTSQRESLSLMPSRPWKLPILQCSCVTLRVKTIEKPTLQEGQTGEMAAQYQPQDGKHPAYLQQPANNESPEVQQAFPEPVKPQDQYLGQVPLSVQPGGYYVQPQQATSPDNTHLLIAWILFGPHIPWVALRSAFTVTSIWLMWASSRTDVRID
jgi:hypothetical protein